MQIARIIDATRVLGQSQGYLGLPIRDDVQVDVTTGEHVRTMSTAWTPTPEELDRLNKGANIIFSMYGSAHPPCLMEVGYTEDTCPEHIASRNDPKICRNCGVHIDELRPPD